MGSFIGHALPGTFFLLGGLWWLYHVVLEYIATLKQPQVALQYRSWKTIPSRSSRNHPIEPWFKLVAGCIGINAELARVHWSLVDKSNEFQSPNKFAHASMYGFFAFSGLVELLNFYKLMYFSRELEYTMLAAAFGFEGLLFFFHLHGRDMFDVRIHTILFIIIFMTALVVLMEACLPKYRRELFMARTVLLLTQATWFWEIAFTIYGPSRWIVGEKMSEKQLMLATEVVTVNVGWHILGWCGFLLICCVLASCLNRRAKCSTCCLHWSGTEKGESLLNPRFGVKGDESDEEKRLLSEDWNCNDKSTDEQIRKDDDDEASA